MTSSTSSYNKRRTALWTFLTWYVSQELAIVGASMPTQHRLPSTQRKVLYHHVIHGLPRNELNEYHTKVHYSHEKEKQTQQKHQQQQQQQSLSRQVHEHGTFWVLEVTSRSDDTEARRRRTKTTKTRNLESSQKQNDDGNYDDDDDIQRPGYTRTLWRRLFDQFVGADSLPQLSADAGNANNSGFVGSTTTTTTTAAANVTTEVEFETAADPNTGNNSSNAHSDAVDGNSHHEESINNVTTVTGNATHAGNITESVVYTRPAEGTTNSSTSSNSTDAVSTNSTEFQPLRLRAILVEDSGNRASLLDEVERNALFHDMLSPALLAWSSSLRVDPVVGNLTVDVSQLLDGETCGPGMDSGLPSIQVPIHHITEGIPETDMIVYLSLGFAVKSHNDSDDAEKNSGVFDAYNGTNNPVPTDDLVVYEVNSDSRDGFGNRVENILEAVNGDRGVRRRRAASDLNASIHEEVEAYDEQGEGDPPIAAGGRVGPLKDAQAEPFNGTNPTETTNICTGDYLAAASYCSSDQYDRPTAAMLHICIDDTFFDPKHLRRNILTLMHELGHALGFNSMSMAHFRRPDGSPYTPRDNNGDVPMKEVECTGAETERAHATVPLPSEEILEFREVRGGVRVAEIVTPSVLQVVRNQFDCQLLTGAELESGEGLPLSVQGFEGCLGDHWERRLFSSDLMNPVVDDLEYSTRISTLTLAYFADSGWYQVDLSNADVASGWGRGAGCSFVNDTCINENGEVPPQNAPFFCNEIPNPGLFISQDIHGCTPDLSRKATCSIGQYDLDLPPAYQYFNSTYGSDVGGSDTLMDFCPVYAGYDNGLCSNKENEAAIKAFDVERFGQRNSRCLVGNVRPFYQPTALCLPIACVVQDQSLRVKVEDRWHVCERHNQRIISGSVTIECPDPRRVCPTFFCPFDCLGTDGECDYSSGNCLCHYRNSTNTTETVLDVCGMVEDVHIVDEGSTLLRPILRPDAPGKRDSAMPPPDTKLSDYYVVDANSLEENPLMEAFAIALVGLTGALVLSFVVFFVFLRKSSSDTSPNSANFFGFFRNQTGSNDANDDSLDFPANSNKDKMVATVLLDMRVQNRNDSRWRRRNLDESLAETEGRLTDSEAASGPESMSEMSSRRSETSELDVSQNGLSVEDLPPEHQEEPQVIRRRRNFFHI